MAQQRLALDHWRQEKLNKRVTLQKVSMSGESQDMVSDLLHEISGADAEDVIFGAEGQMAELGTQLQHSDEAKFLLRALLELRFRRDHAQQACAFVFAENAGDLVGKDHLLTSALDWLCLHVEDKHLPRQFASLSRIEVVVGQKKAVTTASMPPPNFGPERRIDPEDGNAYTLEEFIDAYGGTKEWEAQAHQSARFHAQAAAHAAAAKEQYELAVASQRHASDISAVQQQQIFRLMSFGFSRRKIVEALEAQAGQREMADEDEVLGMLLRGILERRRRGAAADAEQARQARLTSLTGSALMAEREEMAEMWAEEQEALLGIFGEDSGDFAKTSKVRCDIVLRCDLGEGAAKHARTGEAGGAVAMPQQEQQEVRVVVVVPADSLYPAEAPLLGFICDALLPKTCLEVSKRLLSEATRLVHTNVTDYEAPAPVIWELCSWLKEELPQILQLVMPGQWLDDALLEPELEPEPELSPAPGAGGYANKYERTRAREEKLKEQERLVKMEALNRLMDAGEMLLQDRDGPQFNYELQWEQDGSTSRVIAARVPSDLRPEQPLGTYHDRSAMPGLEEYEVGMAVRARYSGEWLKATILAKIRIERKKLSERRAEAEQKKVAEIQAQEAAKIEQARAEKEREAMELAALEEEKQMDEATARLTAHRKLIERSKQIREEMGRRQQRAATVADHERVLKAFRRSQQNPKYVAMQAVRQKLPAAKKKQELLDLLHDSNVLVVSGETGCGKTTQVPQFLMDEMIEAGKGASLSMICTQPRRISAVSVAERVASERGEPVGRSVGYQIRLERKSCAETKLLFCTTGILLRRLQGDGNLDGVSHVVVDEIHERSIDSDFLLIILRDLAIKRPDIKLILMSATLNAALFSSYFGNCPCIEIPGFTHPVTEHYLEDCLELTGYVVDPTGDYAKEGASDARHAGGGGGVAERGVGGHSTKGRITAFDAEEATKLQHKAYEAEERLRKQYAGYSDTVISSLQVVDETVINNELIEALIVAIAEPANGFPEGAVLVFLPGLMEITNLYEQLCSNRVDLPPECFRILPLHSTLSTQEQQRVFEKMPKGVRKVVLSTNIAETSVTIDDVVFVIDCGRHKENRFDPVNRMPQLMETWVSRANSRQRRGRAGRVRPGHCFFLFTSERSKNMAEFQTPEMLRVPLDELCLQIKLLDLGEVKEFLGKAIEPPAEEAVEQAIKGLQELQALDLREYLTPLGYHLAALPVNVRVGKMMLYGTIFRALDPVLTIAAGLSFRSPFVAPFEKREEADKARKKFAGGNRSDHLTLLKAYEGWVRAKARGGEHQYCMTNFLSPNAMRMIAQSKRQFVDLLVEIGFVRLEKGGVMEHGDDTQSEGGGVGGRGGHGGRGGGPRRGGRRGRGNEILKFGGSFYNANSKATALVKAVICAGLYPNIVRVQPQAPQRPSRDGRPRPPRAPKLMNREGGEVFIHPISCNFDPSLTFPSPFLMYFEKVKTTKVYVRDSTMVTPYPLLLFGGEIIVRHEDMVIQIDGWIEFTSMGKVAVLIKRLRQELDKLLVEKIDKPATDFDEIEDTAEKTLQTIVQLIVNEEGNGS